ncbi:heme exporter protein CcmD [Legionella taurinensis]|nr:heme exporter protein CcmD [Legionella taurinensis]MDX1838808.1 heme exporter protein CcmD [Legionella taurinensis]STY25881.1 cytochrome c-type biogenesis protein CcmD [Legionella taurinensis]
MNWLAMGKYAMYIWPAYGLVCGVLALLLLDIKRQQKRTRSKLNQWFRRQ